MRLTVSHKTTYRYDAPVDYALQQLRLMPKNSTGQSVISWSTEIDGGKKEASYTDQHRNHVELISFTPGTVEMTVTCAGEIETTLKDGVVGRHVGLAPLWYFKRATNLTEPGPAIRKIARKAAAADDNDIARMHLLMNDIADTVAYQVGETGAETKAEAALTSGHGVCQDHAHIFIAATRLMDYPARYVSGYLMLNDRVDQDASHAWAEVYLPNIGWTGFDVSNRISPDERYVRVATGLDYREAAPMSGMRFGAGSEAMVVSLQVQQ
ncbi:MAG: transglutaminase family protein [Pseudomonadota bacterium]